MLKDSRLTLAASVLCAALAGCETPSEPTRARQIEQLPGDRSASISYREPLGRHSSSTITYEVPPGVHVLAFTLAGDPLFQGLRFSFTGPAHVFHVRRVTGGSSCPAPDIYFFTGATLRDATVFFAENPAWAWTSQFDLTVENITDATVTLRVTARYEAVGGNPPCPI